MQPLLKKKKQAIYRVTMSKFSAMSGAKWVKTCFFGV